MERDDSQLGLSDGTLQFTMWTVGFAVAFNVFTAAYALLAGLNPIVRVPINGAIVVLLLFLNKLLLLRPFSVSYFIALAALISIFTTTFGPPSPYKVLFASAGLLFDIGTRFRTSSLRNYDLFLGLLPYGACVGFLYVATIGWVLPEARQAVSAAIVPAIAVMYVMGALVAPALYRYLPPTDQAPRLVRTIRRQVSNRREDLPEE